jgi:hypothetical protein
MKYLLAIAALALSGNSQAANSPRAESVKTPNQRELRDALYTLRAAGVLEPTDSGLLIRSETLKAKYEQLDVDGFEAERSEVSIPRTMWC